MVVVFWTFDILCGICLYCEGGAGMARKAVQTIKHNNDLSDSMLAVVNIGSLFSYAEEGLG